MFRQFYPGENNNACLSLSLLHRFTMAGIIWTQITLTNYAQEHWDPNSALSKNEQKRSLLNKWIRLGRYGRNVNYSFPHMFSLLPQYR